MNINDDGEKGRGNRASVYDLDAILTDWSSEHDAYVPGTKSCYVARRAAVRVHSTPYSPYAPSSCGPEVDVLTSPLQLAP